MLLLSAIHPEGIEHKRASVFPTRFATVDDAKGLRGHVHTCHVPFKSLSLFSLLLLYISLSYIDFDLPCINEMMQSEACLNISI